MRNVTDEFVKFALEYADYDKIPAEVIHESKRVLLDGLGNALGGIASDKGKIGIMFARRQGGNGAASLIGVGGKSSAAVAAFCNAELWNGLDMDPVPHVPPIVIPAILAVAEERGSTGKELLAALCVGQEVARRLSRVLLSIMTKSIMKYGKTPDFFGNSNEHIIGAAVGCGMLMKLNEKQMRNAIGIAAYYCSLGVCRDWESTSPKSMIKYVPVSWMAQGAVQAAEMAELGYTGNEYTLDSEYGFPHIYCREPDVWDPEKVVEELGSRWFFTEYHYKPYPVCRYLHSVLDAFAILQEKYHFSPEQIEAIDCRTAAFVANPDQYSVANQVDVQFSGPIAMALEAFGYKPGPAWQDKIALNDPRLLAFAKKVTMHVAPEYAELRRKDPLSWYGRVEVTVGGQVYTESVDYSRGTNKDGYRLTDEEIQDRFRLGANCILPDYKAEKVIAETAQLENAANLTALFENLCL